MQTTLDIKIAVQGSNVPDSGVIDSYHKIVATRSINGVGDLVAKSGEPTAVLADEFPVQRDLGDKRSGLEADKNTLTSPGLI